MAEYDVPSRISAEQLLDVIRGYYAKNAHEEPVSTGEVEDITQLTDKVGRQTKFLHNIGILESRGHKRELTEEGAVIGKALFEQNEKQAKTQLHTLLSEWTASDELMPFIQMQNPGREEVLDYLEPENASSDSRGLDALLDLYEWASVVEQDEEGLYSPSEPPKPETSNPAEQSNGEQVSDSENGGEGVGVSDSETNTEPVEGASAPTSSTDIKVNDQVQIELSFTAEDDPEDIKRTVMAVREALSEDPQQD